MAGWKLRPSRLHLALPLVFTLLLLPALPSSLQEKAILKMLFIGNSITYYNDMPSWITELSRSLASAPILQTRDISKAGARLSGHVISSAYGNALDTIRKRTWNVVVLQGYSTEPLDEPDQFFMAVEKFAEEVRANGGEPVLFQTFAYAAGDSIWTYPELVDTRLSSILKG